MQSEHATSIRIKLAIEFPQHGRENMAATNRSIRQVFGGIRFVAYATKYESYWLVMRSNPVETAVRGCIHSYVRDIINSGAKRMQACGYYLFVKPAPGDSTAKCSAGPFFSLSGRHNESRITFIEQHGVRLNDYTTPP